LKREEIENLVLFLKSGEIENLVSSPSQGEG